MSGREKNSANGELNMKAVRRTVVLPSTGKEAEILAVTGPGDELQAFDSLHPVVQSAQNDWSLPS